MGSDSQARPSASQANKIRKLTFAAGEVAAVAIVDCDLVVLTNEAFLEQKQLFEDLVPAKLVADQAGESESSVP